MSIANKPQPTYGTALLSTAFPIRLAIALAPAFPKSLTPTASKTHPPNEVLVKEEDEVFAYSAIPNASTAILGSSGSLK